MKNAQPVTLNVADSTGHKSYLEIAESNPCEGCSAPCCRMLLTPHPTPATFMDIDYIRYMVGFQKVELAWYKEGQWGVIIEQSCWLLDQESNGCTVHNTPRKPKTCEFYNPYRCWYKRNFHETDNPPDIIRINAANIEEILLYIEFDEDGSITAFPSWDFIKSLAECSAECSIVQNS